MRFKRMDCFSFSSICKYSSWVFRKRDQPLATANFCCRARRAPRSSPSATNRAALEASKWKFPCALASRLSYRSTTNRTFESSRSRPCTFCSSSSPSASPLAVVWPAFTAPSIPVRRLWRVWILPGHLQDKKKTCILTSNLPWTTSSRRRTTRVAEANPHTDSHRFDVFPSANIPSPSLQIPSFAPKLTHACILVGPRKGRGVEMPVLDPCFGWHRASPFRPRDPDRQFAARRERIARSSVREKHLHTCKRTCRKR